MTQLQGADLVAYELVKNRRDLVSNPSANAAPNEEADAGSA
jgi:hypothetical protein